MTDTSKCLRAYAVGDEDVIDGSVENYDFDWGDPVTTPDCRCRNSCGCVDRCSCNCGDSCSCQNRCGCNSSCRCQNCCNCEDTCSCLPEPGPEPEPDPDICSTGSCGCVNTASKEGTYPIIDL